MNEGEQAEEQDGFHFDGESQADDEQHDGEDHVRPTLPLVRVKQCRADSDEDGQEAHERGQHAIAGEAVNTGVAEYTTAR